jgi:Helicase HerA, central domain
VNSDLVPAIVAAGGGSALIGSIWTHEHRRDEAMRASRVRLALRFPADPDPVAAKAALSGLCGLPWDMELLFEVAASDEGIRHFLWVPAAVRASVVSVLAGAMPGLRASEAPAPSGRATLALRVFIPTPTILATENPEASSRTLLSGLATLAPGEQAVIRWAVRPSPAPQLRSDEPLDRKRRELHQAWRQKTQLAGGFQISALVLVRAERVSRARELAEHVASAIRSRRGPVGGPRITSERGNRSLAALPRTTRTSGWLNTSELLPCLGLPLGDQMIPGVEAGVSRELIVPRQIPREGRRLFIGRDARGERPVALSTEAALHHMAVVGPTGVGKSVLIARSILSDIEHGFGGVAIDPKGELDTILDRVKPEHAHRIVVLDPADRRVPGVATLTSGDRDLQAEALTGAIRSAFPAEAWGVRTDYYLRLAIRTLAEVPGATLTDIGRLFFEEPFRRAAIARLRDPFLISAWQSYASLSSNSQAEHLQAPMARIMALLARPKVRAILASPEPKLDVARLLRERKWLLVSLAPGVLGESGAALVGAALMYVIWSAIEARVTLQPAKRHPVFLYVDELATVTNGLPFSFELLAERSRGLGAGLTVALQTLGRIPEPTRSALIGNVASFITFRAGAEEAPRLARQLPGLTDADVMALGRFEVAARIGTGLGSSVAVVTGQTEPLPPKTGQAETIRRRSAEVYGSDPDAPASPHATPSKDDDTPLGRAGRNT